MEMLEYICYIQLKASGFSVACSDMVVFSMSFISVLKLRRESQEKKMSDKKMLIPLIGRLYTSFIGRLT